MEYLILIALFIVFGLITYQDIKFRHIHFILPLLVFAFAYMIRKETLNHIEMAKSTGFLVANFMMISCYFSLKSKKLINPFKTLIGIGDLIFLMGVLPLFSFRNYILFFISGMLFSLLLYASFRKQYVQQTIPLAGYLSLYIILLLCLDFFIPTQLFYDNIF